MSIVDHRPLLDLHELRLQYRLPSGGLHSALDGVSLQLWPGETLGLVGESGCGKSTLARAVMRLVPLQAGRIHFDGEDIGRLPRRTLAQRVRPSLQMVFQDPYASLNPRTRIGDALVEPLRIHRRGTAQEQHAQALDMLARVGLAAEAAQRYPHEFSGGQRQRIAIARALMLRPRLLVCDEAVSALDVSVRAQVLNLLLELRQSLGLAMLFISHDLAVVEYIADRVAVLYLGRIMEIAPARDIIRTPKHPYTQALLSAVPEPDPDAKRRRIVLQGDLPSPMAPPSGCVFRTRCPYAIAACAEAVPDLREIAPGHRTACIRTDIL